MVSTARVYKPCKRVGMPVHVARTRARTCATTRACKHANLHAHVEAPRSSRTCSAEQQHPCAQHPHHNEPAFTTYGMSPSSVRLLSTANNPYGGEPVRYTSNEADFRGRHHANHAWIMNGWLAFK